MDKFKSAGANNAAARRVFNARRVFYGIHELGTGKAQKASRLY
jgi:hypothetical protein